MVQHHNEKTTRIFKVSFVHMYTRALCMTKLGNHLNNCLSISLSDISVRHQNLTTFLTSSLISFIPSCPHSLIIHSLPYTIFNALYIQMHHDHADGYHSNLTHLLFFKQLSTTILLFLTSFKPYAYKQNTNILIHLSSHTLLCLICFLKHSSSKGLVTGG